MSRQLCKAILVLVFLQASQSFAQRHNDSLETDEQKKVRLERIENLRRKKEEERKLWFKKMGMAEEPAPTPSLKRDFVWSGSFGYAVRTDLADQVKPRIYTHSLNLGAGLNYRENLSVSLMWGVVYESLGDRGGEINVSENEKELFLRDLSLDAAYTNKFGDGVSYSFALGNEFPTSPDTRREEIASITSIDAWVAKSFFKEQVTLRLSGGVHQIWHSYYYSPTTGEVNKEGGSVASLGLSYRPIKSVTLAVSAGAQVSRYKDSTNDMTYRNSISASYRWQSLSATLGLINGTYLDGPDESTLWYIDENRRILNFSLNYAW